MNIHVERKTSQFSGKLYALSLGWYLFGLCTGAVGMVWHYEAKPKPGPIVLEIEKTVPASGHLGKLEQQLAQLKADQVAAYARQEQRNKEQAFTLRKLQGLKQTWDVALQEAR